MSKSDLIHGSSSSILQEFTPSTASEAKLVSVAEESYRQWDKAADLWNEHITEKRDYYTSSKIPGDRRLKYCDHLSKEMDRASRRFTSAIGMLKQLQTTPMQINIKTNAAYVAQNQQNIDNQ